MKKIIPHLWFDTEAREAAEFYVSLFPESEIKNTSALQDTPSGSVDVVNFELLGLEFQAISAGPLFKFNPSVSFQVLLKTKEAVDNIWNGLSEGGTTLMELAEYPFSERYGWVQDRYGLSWQLLYSSDPAINQKIVPFVLFVGEVCGRAEEAINFWSSVFPDSQVFVVQRYGKGEEPDQVGTLKYATFALSGQDFGAMDSAYEHQFSFNEAISLIVLCDTQEEIDYYWERLSAVPEAEQCGWLKDKFDLSWQIVPAAMGKMFESGDKEKIARLTEAFLKMKKFDIAGLEAAYEGK